MGQALCWVLGAGQPSRPNSPLPGLAGKTREEGLTSVKDESTGAPSELCLSLTGAGPLAETSARKEEAELVGHRRGPGNGEHGQAALVHGTMMLSVGSRNRWACTPDAPLLKRCFIPCPHQGETVAAWVQLTRRG